MAEYKGLSGKQYHTPDAPFAGGGEGDIYDVTGAPDYVAKIYRPDKRTTERERKLSFMTANRPGAMEQYAWPLDVLYENGSFAGYLMPKIKGKEKLRNLYVYDKRKGKPWPLYVAIAKNLSAAVYNVHEIHQVIGDLNPENILVNPNDGMVVLVDTDSYHISDSGRTYRCGVGMPEFVAPELQGIHFPSAPLPTFTPETDRFSLAVLIFALLMNGAHPFACTVISGSSSRFQPIDNMQNGKCAFFPESRAGNMEIPRYAPDIKTLPENLQNLFRRAFVSGHRTPSLRPSAEEWYHALEQLENHLKTCRSDPSHIYYEGAAECPWCQVSRKMSLVFQTAYRHSGQGSFGGQTNKAGQSGIGGHAGRFRQSGYAGGSGVRQGGAVSSYSVGGNKPGKSRRKWRIVVVVSLLALTILGIVSDLTSKDRKDAQTNAPVESSGMAGMQEGSSGQNEQEEAGYADRTIPAIEPLEVFAQPIESASVSAGEAEILFYSGTISSQDQVDRYSFQAAYGGTCRIEAGGLADGMIVKLFLYDSGGNEIKFNTYCTNGSGITVLDLTPGESYEVKVERHSGYGTYSLMIGLPGEPLDISERTEVLDEMEYSDQSNLYSFTALVDGRYRFEINGMEKGMITALYVRDAFGVTLDSYSYCQNGSGVTTDLKAGEEYQIEVAHHTGLGTYVLDIGLQKEALDLTGASLLRDYIEYRDQRNVYSYTIPADGRYHFELSGMANNMAVELYVMNASGETLAYHTYCHNQTGVTLDDLKAGDICEIQICQHTEQGEYTLLIGRQKEMTDIGKGERIHDSMEYREQNNVYSFRTDVPGTVKFTVSGMERGMSVEMYLSNSYGEILVYNQNCANGDGIELANAGAGERYTLQIRQKNEIGSYAVTVD